MEPIENSDNKFSVAKRAKSFAHAVRGIGLFFKTTHNVWIHTVVLVIVIFLGFYFDISRFEWIAIIFACGLVFVSEALNTAIEIDINLTSPEYHPYAKDTKDVAAGAVLLSVVTAVVVGLLVFGHYLF